VKEIRQDDGMKDLDNDATLTQVVEDNRRLLRQLQRSIRSSIALSRRRPEWDPNDLLGHAATFGETLQWRHDELGLDIGLNRTIAVGALESQLRPLITPYVTYFNAYLTIAEHINTAAGDRWRTGKRARVKINVLCELHAQALTIAEEIVTLIGHGLPGGAAARWRTLYELTTIATFIARSPNRVAERYQGSHIVEQQLRINRGDSDYLLRKRGYSGLERERRRLVGEEFTRLVEKYGPEYGHPYGWAAERLKLKRVTFANIETRVGDRGRRYSYVTASQHIHGVRLSSMQTLAHRPDTEAVFEQAPQDSYLVQIDTIWTLQNLTWELASIVSRTQSVPEALYWGYVCHVTALDADTETQRGQFSVYPGYLRGQMSIEPKA
jgi:hypothetical protein